MKLSGHTTATAAGDLIVEMLVPEPEPEPGPVVPQAELPDRNNLES